MSENLTDANEASVGVAVAGVLSKSSHFFTLKEEHRTTLKAFCSGDAWLKSAHHKL